MKILFASPDRDLVSSYGIVIGQRGWESTSAFDGAQVLSVCAEEEFDVAVIDEKLPNSDVFAISRFLKTKYTPVVTLTYSQAGGRDDVIAFPFFPDEFMSCCAASAEKFKKERGEGASKEYGKVDEND